MIGGESSRTGKIEAERIIKYREEKIRQKETMIKKYQTKKDSLSQQVSKLTAQIRKKDELGDDLKFIDFHQLQIENKKYLKEIDDKNGKLLKSKVSTGKITKQWNDMKASLNEEMRRKKELLEGIRDAKKQKKLMKVEKRDVDSVDKKYKTEKGTLEALIKQVEKEGVMNIQKFIQDKDKEAWLDSKIKKYARKIEIIEEKYKVASKNLYSRERDFDVDEMVGEEVEKFVDNFMKKQEEKREAEERKKAGDIYGEEPGVKYEIDPDYDIYSYFDKDELDVLVNSDK